MMRIGSVVLFLPLLDAFSVVPTNPRPTTELCAASDWQRATQTAAAGAILSLSLLTGTPDASLAASTMDVQQTQVRLEQSSQQLAAASKKVEQAQKADDVKVKAVTKAETSAAKIRDNLNKASKQNAQIANDKKASVAKKAKAQEKVDSLQADLNQATETLNKARSLRQETARVLTQAQTAQRTVAKVQSVNEKAAAKTKAAVQEQEKKQAAQQEKIKQAEAKEKAKQQEKLAKEKEAAKKVQEREAKAAKKALSEKKQARQEKIQKAEKKVKQSEGKLKDAQKKLKKKDTKKNRGLVEELKGRVAADKAVVREIKATKL